MAEAAYLAIARRKQAQRAALIPLSWQLPTLPDPLPTDLRTLPLDGVLSPLELSITSSHDAVSLAHAIRTRTLTSAQIVTAFCKRAAVAQQLCNCLTEVWFDAAIARARVLDKEYADTGRLRSELHGVPVSLKDTFRVKGYDASIGIAALAERPAEENSLLVDILLEKGAVLYCKTNIPQTLMALDSDNNVFGRVLNPRNTLLTAGGSSGGEGALLAMRGSILGVGTDIGGSIRVPAMCNGLYGIKPSSQRVPFVGQQTGELPGASELGIPASAGPIATSVRDCEMFLRTLADSQLWERDPAVAFGGWTAQGVVAQKPLIGIIRTDDLIAPLPPISAVIQETVTALHASGIETCELSSPSFKKCQSLANALFGIDGGQHMFSLLNATSEPLTAWLSTRLRPKSPLSLEKVRELHAAKIQLETEMLELWREPGTGRRVDAIICPVAPHPTPPIDRWNGVSYTSAWVLLDCPAGTLPVRDVLPSDLVRDQDERAVPLSSWDKVNRELWHENRIDRKIYLDSTLSIQVVAPKLQERRLLQAMHLIDAALRETEQLRSRL